MPTALCHICGMCLGGFLKGIWPKLPKCAKSLHGNAFGSADSGMMYSSAVVQAG